MGRVSQAQAQENRQRVVATASRMFREKGTAVSVADVMNAAGLTHGGFYKQFASKEDLIDEATAHAFDKPAVYSAAATEDDAGQLENDRRTLIEHYLSPWHRDHAASGCPVSGFAADLGREPDQAAHAHRVYTQGVRNLAAGSPPATTTAWPSCAPWSVPSSSPGPPRVTRSPRNCCRPPARLLPRVTPGSPNRHSAPTDPAEAADVEAISRVREARALSPIP